ncbi:hotdog fold thioesterase [Deinococcus hopiensis]|uniref:Uncharacterized domain 1-containing protein n=1 Tax=Deinococcus hopiensis KR-140 TaxID=695939 RepID=A0A1W1UR00_9DEIO|nr:hotdog fold thioesterase [Deinococcus hopiensis]SMB83124.1 uncharacterized domain 1-containing protein [Deinococcus hopiensis KR-140]
MNTSLAQLSEHARGALPDHLGIEILEAGSERVVARMPVERRVHQPFGVLHGGASVVLAETAASVGAHLSVAARGMTAVGLEINANHLRAVRSGFVTATATPIHQGRTTQVWQIEIVDEQGRGVCASRCTLAVIPASTPPL